MGNEGVDGNQPKVVRPLAPALELVARSLRFWRIPAQVHREDVLQEACLQWLRRQAEPRSSDEVDVRVLLGIARKVLREWRRGELVRERLRASLGRDEPWVLEPLERCDFRSRTELSQWLGERLPREEVAVLLAVRLDGSTWGQACREIGVDRPKAAATMQRRILRGSSGSRVGSSGKRGRSSCALGEALSGEPHLRVPPAARHPLPLPFSPGLSRSPIRGCPRGLRSWSRRRTDGGLDGRRVEVRSWERPTPATLRGQPTHTDS
jgi:DNA-directed RNA polymerase specialized sigma24 family protein